MHRWVWDLRGAPPANPPAVGGGGGGFGRRGTSVSPGEYTVRLTAGGKSFTQKLTVAADPRGSLNAARLNKNKRLLKAAKAEARRK